MQRATRVSDDGISSLPYTRVRPCFVFSVGALASVGPVLCFPCWWTEIKVVITTMMVMMVEMTRRMLMVMMRVKGVINVLWFLSVGVSVDVA